MRRLIGASVVKGDELIDEEMLNVKDLREGKEMNVQIDLSEWYQCISKTIRSSEIFGAIR